MDAAAHVRREFAMLVSTVGSVGSAGSVGSVGSARALFGAALVESISDDEFDGMVIIASKSSA